MTAAEIEGQPAMIIGVKIITALIIFPFLPKF